MTKKFFAVVIIISVAFLWAVPALAVDTPAETAIKEKVDEVLPSDVFGKIEGKTPPTGDFKKEIIPQAIKIVLALAGTVSFGVFVYAGVMLIISQGNEEEITKFKNILIWSIIGLLFITTSYALVSGVMKLSFE